MKAQALHPVENKRQPWIFFAIVLYVITATAFAQEETRGSSKQTNPAVITNTKPFGKFPLLLSTTLSLPGNEPLRPDNSTKIADALLQDSIAKEKILADLNIQIATMEQLIKAQKSQLEGATSAVDSHETLVGNSALIRMSGVSSVSAGRMAGIGKTPLPEIVAPVVPSASSRKESQVELLQVLGLKQAMGLVLIVLALLGLVWHRKYPQVRQQSANNQTVLLPWERTLKIPATRQDKSFGDLDMTEVRK